ncbi:MAG: hypothetical protein AB2777_14610 [Candidatus Thiodiazotropha endolucinida]
MLPSLLVVTYVVGFDDDGDYYYVVNQLLNTEYEVDGEEAAKQSVLFEIDRILDEMLSIG